MQPIDIIGIDWFKTDDGFFVFFVIMENFPKLFSTCSKKNLQHFANVPKFEVNCELDVDDDATTILA